MNIRHALPRLPSGCGHLLLIPLLLGLTSCATPRSAKPPVTITANQTNVVAYWNDIANQTVLAPSAVNTTPEEQRATFFFDVASVHVAIYDAVVAIEGRYKPFAVRPKAPAAGASTEAAVSAAAYGVLQALFPNRSAVYQAAYEQRLAAMRDGPAKTMGLALGSEVAAEVVRLRANDGRSVALAPYVSGTAAGQFRAANPNPVFRHFPSIKPFALESMGQFRPAPPPPAVTRNLGRFASSTANVGDAARLMAVIYVSFADAIGACFEAKYHCGTWRPVSAIQMADADGNDATAPDAAWAPSLPTPNHPEYPAAHSCTSGSLGEALRSYYGTPDVTFTWDSTVTKTTRTYAGIDAFNAEAGLARIHGGMHFRYATVAGEELGRRVAQWVAQHHFARQV